MSALISAAERKHAARLIEKHRIRLLELERDAIKLARPWAAGFAGDYGGKVLFAIALASSAAALCTLTPGLRPEHFLADVKAAAAVWCDLGEPKVGPA